MKPKKLTLKKTTIVHLENEELKKAQGGAWTVYPNATCGIITCERTFCNNCTMPMPCFHP